MQNKSKYSPKSIVDYLSHLSIDSKLLLGYLLLLFILTPVRFVLHRFGIDEGVFRETVLCIISSIPLICFFVFSSKKQIKDCWPAYVIWVLVYISIYVVYLTTPDMSYFLFRENYGILRVIRPDSAMYALLFFMLIKNGEELLNDLRIFAYLDFAYLFIFELIPYLRDGGWSDVGPDGLPIKLSYNLSFGYSMLTATLIFFLCYMIEKKKIDFIFGCMGFYEIFTNGNRGAFLLVSGFAFLITVQRALYSNNRTYRIYLIAGLSINVAIFYLVKDPITIASVFLLNGVINDDRVKNIKKKFWIIIGVTIGLILMFTVIVDVLLPLLNAQNGNEALGYVNRNQAMLENGSFTSSNGRADIWTSVFNAIKQRPLFGYGFYGDRPFVYPHHFTAYSHNIFLELACSYGIVGIIIILYFIFDAIRMFFNCKNHIWREIYLTFFVISCQLLISYSFWYVFEVWATFAISYTYRHFIKVNEDK